jgi:hypothetical protein
VCVSGPLLIWLSNAPCSRVLHVCVWWGVGVVAVVVGWGVVVC